jgi:hypothetical protein
MMNARTYALVLSLSLAVGCQERAAPAQETAPATPTATPTGVVEAQPAPLPADSVSAPAADTASDPAAVLRRYYAAINARDYRQAYAQWGADGGASKQTFEVFATGFAQTKRVEATIGKPGRVEGAAGSRYVEVPVEIRAETMGGEAQHFSGFYALRQVVADGATKEQRQWHLYSADLKTR